MIVYEQYSKNFSLKELVYSDIAARQPQLKILQETPSEDVRKALRELCMRTLQPIRDSWGHPIRVTSGYRCSLLNNLVGSKDTSQHPKGEAADIVAESVLESVRNKIIQWIFDVTGTKPVTYNLNYLVFCACVLSLKEWGIDQLIHEYGTPGNPDWVHVSHSQEVNRGQILQINKFGTKILDVKEALMLGCV